MSTALATRDDVHTLVTPDQLDLIKRTVANGATADELKLYLFDCQRQGVHPLDKLVHFTKRAGKYTPITSIDFMRIRAAETNEYAGSDDAMFDMGPDMQAMRAATVTVWRLVQGHRCAFTATARWSEYKPEQNDFMWKKMPHTMLAKCAEALALRKGFPRQLAGLYAKEEMDQAGEPQGYVVTAPTPTAPTSRAVLGTIPSKPNGGDSDSRPVRAEMLAEADLSAGAKSDDGPDLGVDMPAGAKRIIKVEPKKNGTEAYVTFHDGSEHIAYKSQLVALAEQLCQNHTPFFPDMKKSASGNFYIVGFAPIPKDYEPPQGEMVDVKDIAF